MKINMDTNTDLSKSFNKLMGDIFINFRGTLIERTPQGYKWNGQCFYTLEELDKAISKSGELLSNSISK